MIEGRRWRDCESIYRRKKIGILEDRKIGRERRDLRKRTISSH
jgi:hypothetical protein